MHVCSETKSFKTLRRSMTVILSKIVHRDDGDSHEAFQEDAIMNHCRDRNNDPICLDCVGDRQDLANAVNASDHSIECILCGGEIPSIVTREIPVERNNKIIGVLIVAAIVGSVLVFMLAYTFGR